MAFQLPELPYSYDALEPHIDARTMEIHHTKHHQGYTNNLNAALEKHPDWAERSIEDILANLDSVPQDVRTAVRNNGGGFYNHRLFWQMMSPNGGGEPTGDLGNAIKSKFGSLQGFSETFRSTSAKQFGSGWGWLVKKSDGSLAVVSTSNANNPMTEGHTPLLTCDVWEHAYYIDYRNARPKFVEAFWNIVNWADVQARFNAARAGAAKLVTPN